MKLKTLILITVFLSLGFFSDAKYVQTCKIKYKTNYEWSKYYTVEVNFLTGSELNSATRTFNYQAFSVYAVVFWGNDQASVVKISSILMCGNEVSKECIINSLTNLKGEDQQGKNWEICVTGYCY